MASPFFFSYAHNDALDESLDAFFKHLNRRVRGLTGINQDGYRDITNAREGEVWPQALVGELRASPVMVCMYSPSFFKSRICAREVQVFLERRARYNREQTGAPAANIIPVLWEPADVPITLPDFQQARPLSPDFSGQSVRYVWDFADQKEFKLIAERVAVRVKEAAKTPLPVLDLDLTLGGIESAFGPPPLPPEDFDGPAITGGPDCVTYVYATAPAWNEWPFGPPQERALLWLSAAVAKGRDLRPHKVAFHAVPGQLRPRLEAARGRNNLVVLLVDGSRLGDAALAGCLRELDAAPLDACSTLVVWPPGTRNAAAQQRVAEVFPNLRLRQPPFFFGAIESENSFVDAVGQGVDALRNLVLRNPRGLDPLPPTSSFTTVPGVSGPGVDRAA